MPIVSYIILGIMLVIFFLSIHYNTGYDIIDYPIRAFYHGNLNHLIANGISLYSLSFMENVIGSWTFLFAIIFIWIVSSLLLYLEHLILPSRKVYTIGFSGVIFGLIVLYYTLLNQSPGITSLGLIVSIVPQIFMPGISWEGHICGIIAGLLYVMLFPLDKRLNINQMTY